jgi:hypothetical protein
VNRVDEAAFRSSTKEAQAVQDNFETPDVIDGWRGAEMFDDAF